MEDQLVSLETAKLAKEKGFDIVCKKLYKKDGDIESCNNEYGISYDKVSGKFNYKNKGYMFAPTQSLLQKWLRDVHKIHISIHPGYYKGEIYQWTLQIKSTYYKENYKTYEEALELALQEALQLIK